MTETRHTTLTLAACIVAVVLLALAGVYAVRQSIQPGSSTTGQDASAPTPAETRATVAAGRGAAAAGILLGQSDGESARADSLSALLRFERLRSAPLFAALASSRAATDRALDSVRVDTVLVRDATGLESPSDLPDLLATRIVVERAASDRALEQCETRATLSDSVAEAQASRATWAYAAADSALAALSYTRLAYAEADRRASSASRLATRRGRLLTVAGGLLVGACAVAILR